MSWSSPPFVILYTTISHHAETPKQKQVYNMFGLRVQDYSNMVMHRDGSIFFFKYVKEIYK